jgi:integrase
MLLAREAALRIGTILQFSVSNCDFNRRQITGRTKRHASYTLPMTKRLYEKLLWCAAGARDALEPLLAQYHTGERKTYEYASLHRALRDTQQAAGLRRGAWSFHDLRRTAARELYQSTKDIRKVQRLLAHSNPWHTFWYLGNAGLDLDAEDIEQVHAKPARKDGTNG